MANSKYEYVREFESDDSLLRNTWIVVRIDGRGFHKLSKKYDFEKPNDKRALDLMNAAAMAVMEEISHLVLAYGISDEYSFIFHKDTNLFGRRSSKLISTIVSTFTAYYVGYWMKYFPEIRLSPPMPTFDGRCILYPTVGNLRDYVSWRQADCHINNLYNTTFWSLIQTSRLTNTQAETKLQGTTSATKNELLFQNGINYNNEPPLYRKGSVLYRDYELATTPLEGSASILEAVVSDTEELPLREQQIAASKSAQERERKSKRKAGIMLEHCDLINNDFWHLRPWILSGKAGKLKTRASAEAVLPAGGFGDDGEETVGLIVGIGNGVDGVGIESR